MSNFDPHELKPDSSDRPNTNRPKRNEPAYLNIKTWLKHFNISRQHLMIAIGILVLLIIILTIMSTLKSSDNNNAQPQSQDITLSNQSNPSESNNAVTNSVPNNNDPLANLPPIAPPPEITISPENIATNTSEPQTNTTPVAPQQPAVNTPATTNTVPAPTQQTSITNLPNNHVTLQLSSASQSKTLEAFAKKQNLEQYWIYETRRDNKPWFVLIYGSYPNVQQANQAVSTLPADVQAKKPWVKPIRQVQQEAKQR